MRWILEGPERIGQVVIWGDGQAEIDLAEVGTGEVRTQHRRADDHDGLVAILESVLDWVVSQGDWSFLIRDRR